MSPRQMSGDHSTNVLYQAALRYSTSDLPSISTRTMNNNEKAKHCLDIFSLQHSLRQSFEYSDRQVAPFLYVHSKCSIGEWMRLLPKEKENIATVSILAHFPRRQMTSINVSVHRPKELICSLASLLLKINWARLPRCTFACWWNVKGEVERVWRRRIKNRSNLQSASNDFNGADVLCAGKKVVEIVPEVVVGIWSNNWKRSFAICSLFTDQVDWRRVNRWPVDRWDSTKISSLQWTPTSRLKI